MTENKAFLENEKKRLLWDPNLQYEKQQEHIFKKGYTDCKPGCSCGSVCKNCIINIPKCAPGCKCDASVKNNFKTRANRVCKGAANILAGWPFDLLHVTICVILIIFLLLMVTIIVFNILLHNHGHKEIVGSNPSGLTKRNSLCKEVTADNGSLFIMGYLDAQTAEAKAYTRPMKNVFYVTYKHITSEEACNIESLLRLLTDKLVYIIELNNLGNAVVDYVDYLQKRYVNFNRIRTNETHFFEGSIFENDWQKSTGSKRVLAAKVLTVWQFGGMAISENLAVNSRNVIDTYKDICFADREVVYCSQECSAYTFALMKVILNDMRNELAEASSFDREIDALIDSSINDFCSNEVAKIGCNRVYRLQKSDMCEDDSGECQFIRAYDLKSFVNYKGLQTQFCPYISMLEE